MTVAIAGILQESNTFSPVKTRYQDFSPVFGEAALERHRGKATEMGGFIDVLSAARVRMAPVCAAWAITAGRMVRRDYERLAGEFERHLARVRRPTALLLAMHGAQTAEGVDDVEGSLLAIARRVLGDTVPIVVTLDLHANVTRAMVEHATAIVGYHTYPHVDLYETGVKAAHLLLRTLAGKVRPVMRFRKLPMIVPAENMQTTSGPMHRLIERGKALERRGGALAVSVFGVQPWLDIQEMGGAVVVVADGAVRRADATADSLAQRFWESRHEFDVRLTPPAQAIRRALRISGGPVVLSESSDSTGSGSPGDSTGLLRALLSARLREPVAFFMVDPDAVDRAMRAGVGKTVTMPIGGKLDPARSRPVRVTGRVRLLSTGLWTPRARGYNTGIETSMGRAVVLDVGSIRTLIAERSTMTVDPELYRSQGIEPLDMKIVAVKSPNGFRAAYEPIAKAIFIVDTPGASAANLRSLPYRRVPRPIYPLDSGIRLGTGLSRRHGRS
jgi:microcystin degradation protein MlrC